MLSILACVFAVSVSASEITFICQDEYELSFLTGDYYSFTNSSEYDGLPGRLNFINCGNIYAFEPNSFKTFVDFHLNKNGDSTYQEWYEFCSNKVDEGTSDNVLMTWYYEADNCYLNESFFNKVYNYKPVTHDDVNAGMNKFSNELKQLFSEYEYECKIYGTSVTAEGFDQHVEKSRYSDEFKEAYKSYGAQQVLSSMYSAGANSQSGSSGSTGGSNEDVGSGQNGSPNLSDDELTEGESMAEIPGCSVCNMSGTCEHFIAGYQQGFHDALLSDLNKDNLQQAFDQGYTYSNSEDFQTTINVAKQESIEEYKQSDEYNKALQDNLEQWQSSEEFSQIIDSTIEESVNDFKMSEEYNATLDAQYNAGVQSGYNSGYSEAAELVYDKGVLAGMAQYQSSAEYQNSMQGFYNDGYFDGYDKGHADGKSVPNVTGLILLIISIIGAVILFAVVSKKIKKKKRGSK